MELVHHGDQVLQAFPGDAVPEPEVCVATVDNFQGKERRVVVGSLVRSNGNGKLGFLAAPQRVNVLLSRARDGLILVANPFTLLGHVGTLEQNAELARHSTSTSSQQGPRQIRYSAATAAAVQQHAAGKQAKKGKPSAHNAWLTVLGSGNLPIVTGVTVKQRCGKHPHKTFLQTAADFASHPRLGQRSCKCNAKMPCGHKCKKLCHTGGDTCNV